MIRFNFDSEIILKNFIIKNKVRKYISLVVSLAMLAPVLDKDQVNEVVSAYKSSGAVAAKLGTVAVRNITLDLNVVALYLTELENHSADWLNQIRKLANLFNADYYLPRGVNLIEEDGSKALFSSVLKHYGVTPITKIYEAHWIKQKLIQQANV